MIRSVPDPTDFLHSSDSEDSNVSVVRVEDKGSKPPMVNVEIQGVPANGIIDSGTDITIMNDQLFQKVAAVAHLKNVCSRNLTEFLSHMTVNHLLSMVRLGYNI